MLPAGGRPDALLRVVRQQTVLLHQRLGKLRGQIVEERQVRGAFHAVEQTGPCQREHARAHGRDLHALAVGRDQPVADGERVGGIGCEQPCLGVPGAPVGGDLMRVGETGDDDQIRFLVVVAQRGGGDGHAVVECLGACIRDEVDDRTVGRAVHDGIVVEDLDDGDDVERPHRAGQRYRNAHVRSFPRVPARLPACRHDSRGRRWTAGRVSQVRWSAIQ